ncbi:MAG: hypothetical protein ABIT37_13070 [Luteolibacter sp.]
MIHLFRSLGLAALATTSAPAAAVDPYPAALVASPGGTTYHVDPAKGDDTRAGTAPATAWKTFARVNGLKLAAGDRVLVAPGVHEFSLTPHAAASVEKPAVIRFLAGTHEFAPEKALRRPWFVSNSSDAPTVPKPMAILIEDSRHLRLQGVGVEGAGKTLILMGGRMIEAVNNRSEDIAYSGLVFDLKRPTVSEYRVMEVQGDTAVIAVAEGSTYEIKGGKFSWTGDIGSGAVMVQQAIPAEGHAWRRGFGWDPFTPSVAVELAPGKVQLTCGKGSGAYGMAPGHQYQFRRITRDSVGVHNVRSKDIAFRDCDFYALTNMGIVSQFTDGITLQRVRVAPPKGTIRTCPAWGDVFHFSNCKGDILVADCVESGTQDDAINCHGTHLRIVGKPAENQLKLRYMQPQTYGFAPYVAGDEIAVIDHNKLRERPNNPRRGVTACEQSDQEGKNWTVTLDGPAPAFNPDNVVDNITWHPNMTVRNNFVTMDSCRGYLITTRGKVVVENNTFNRCHMPGILIEDDARGWFESTCVRDMTIKNNTFTGCGIEINPQTVSGDPKEPVHENIRIENNTFDGGGISAKSVKGLVVTGNKTPAGAKVSADIAPSCSEVKVD